MANPLCRQQYAALQQYYRRDWPEEDRPTREAAEDCYDLALHLVRYLGQELIGLIGTLDAVGSSLTDLIESRMTAHSPFGMRVPGQKVEYLGTLVEEILEGIDAKLAAHDEPPLIEEAATTTTATATNWQEEGF